jgi:hypothetical protein
MQSGHVVVVVVVVVVDVGVDFDGRRWVVIVGAAVVDEAVDAVAGIGWIAVVYLHLAYRPALEYTPDQLNLQSSAVQVLERVFVVLHHLTPRD